MSEKYQNPFVLPIDEYKRDLNPIKNYIDQSANYLSISTGKPYSQCREFVIQAIKPNGILPITDPEFTVYHRESGEDRVRTTIKLSQYLRKINQESLIISPTMTTYLPHKDVQSPYNGYIRVNKKLRSVAKKAELRYKQLGNREKSKFENSKQTSKKRSNNALSGAQASAGTILSNKSAHPSLTSTCRTTSGLGNANNEKLISGNRHYHSYQITLNNLVSIVSNTNYAQLAAVVSLYGLHCPTVEETMQVLRFSTDRYWRNPKSLHKIEAFLTRLTPLNRAAICYTGDLFHIRNLNPAFMRRFIERMCETPMCEQGKASEILSKYPESFTALASQLKEEEFRGLEFDKHIKGTDKERLLAGIVQNIVAVLTEYAPFIKCFFTTTNIPASVAVFAESERDIALVSDTDSTIFTVQEWVNWYFGEIRCGAAENAVAAIIIFFAAESITHVLAQMSTNIGVDKSILTLIAMKNEFKFDSFLVTNLGKHYAALIGCREGNLYDEYEEERKGVNLKNGAVPQAAVEATDKLLEKILHAPIKNEKLRLADLLKIVSDCEVEIIREIKKGSPLYFRRAQIKPADSYKDKQNNSTYAHHLRWEAVFADKYGSPGEPPYAVIKIKTTLVSATETAKWIANMEDRALAQRMTDYIAKTGKKDLPVILVPMVVVRNSGIPDEIMQCIGVRGMVRESTAAMTIIMEAMGYYYENKKVTRLVSEELV